MDKRFNNSNNSIDRNLSNEPVKDCANGLNYEAEYKKMCSVNCKLKYRLDASIRALKAMSELI